jgi:hypothetical protein
MVFELLKIFFYVNMYVKNKIYVNIIYDFTTPNELEQKDGQTDGRTDGQKDRQTDRSSTDPTEIFRLERGFGQVHSHVGEL